MNEKLNERSRQILDEIKRRTLTPAYKLAFDTESAPTIFDSKVGSLPYWDPAKTYPTDSKGNKMRLLAQINFDREKVESPLPQGGMLQFFLAYDDVYGLHNHDEIRQKNWRVVYHEKIDTNMNAELVEGLGIPTDTENQEYCSPVLKSCVFHLVKKETWITSMHSDAFDALTLELAEELFGETEADFGSDVFGDEQFTLIVEEDSHNKNSQLLGHPYFTQEDVREEGSRYDTLLFQLDSETVDKEKITMWGDCGVGNFFINIEDLKRLDFSNVLYNWDCC